MSSSTISNVILRDNDYCKIAIDLFQKYALANLEDVALLEVIQIDFKY